MASATNPFTLPSRTLVERDIDHETYVFPKQGPNVASTEIESAHAEAIEITLSWGTNVLSVSHLAPPRAFTIGEAGECILPEELLGVSTLALVDVIDNRVHLNVPRGATGTAEVPGAPISSLERLISDVASDAGSRALPIAPGTRVTVKLAGSELEFAIRVVPAGKKFALDHVAWVASAVTGAIGLSLLGHVGTVGAIAFLAPHLANDDDNSISRENILYMQKMLNASAENERLREETAGSGADSPEAGAPGAAAKGEAGKAGSTVSKNTNGRFGVAGESRDPHLARMSDLQIAREEGMVGILLRSASSNAHAPTSPWGEDTAEGNDSKNAIGNIFGSTIDDAAGSGGLALSGTGESGGGPGTGIGVTGISGLGNCITLPCGNGPGGFAHGSAPLRGGHTPNFHMPRASKTEVNGQIPADVIQRIVRLNFGRFRNCYETGLRTNPSLTGRIATKFIIDRTGGVMTAQDGGSDLPDQAVVSCVVKSFQTLSFPNPQGGLVTVNYPLLFSPDQ